jgi:uncharacterized protein YlxW (UPF0749 family)
LSRTIAILTLFLGATSVFLFFMLRLSLQEIKSLESEKTTLQANNNILLNEVKKRNEQAEELARTKVELQKAIESDTSGFNWGVDISGSTPVLTIKRLHKDRNTVRSN